MIDIIKKSNGNVFIVENNATKVVLSSNATIELNKFSNDRVIIKDRSAKDFEIITNQVASTQIEPAAAIPFDGNTTQLLEVLGDGFFLPKTNGGGGGAVDSVNGKTGAVVLDPDDLDDSTTTNKFVTDGDLAKLSQTSGTNTGDETTSTIQSKRPIKTINGQSLEGSGDITIGGSGGDMLKSIYDVNDNGIVDKSQNVIFKGQLNQNAVKGNLLYGVGRNPSTGDPIVGLADNTVSFADKTVGMALESGNSGDIIEIVKIGVIEDIDTSLYAVGETIYLSTFGTFDQKSNITTGVFNPVGFVVKSAVADGAIIIDTTATESISTDNTINDSSIEGRTVTEALENLLPLYKSSQASLSRAGQTTIPLANQQQNVFEEYFEDSFTPSRTDNYRVGIRWKWSSNVTQQSATFKVTFSSSDSSPDIVLISTIEPKDAGGLGELVNVLENGVIVGNVNTGTSERLPGEEVADVILTSGVTYNIKLEWTNDSNNSALTIYSSTIRWEQKTQNF